MSFLRPLESFIGMFQCLPGVLVSGLVIFFPVVRGGGAVCVCGVFVEFGSSLVRFIWHCFPILSGHSDLTCSHSVLPPEESRWCATSSAWG
jgi:hypothetical protein